MFAGVFSVYTYSIHGGVRNKPTISKKPFALLWQHQFEYRDCVNYAHCDLQ